jgi:hypothetical protein
MYAFLESVFRGSVHANMSEWEHTGIRGGCSLGYTKVEEAVQGQSVSSLRMFCT